MSAQPIRILHALGTLDPGGVETWLLNVWRNIDRSRFQFDFCTFGARPGLYAAEIEGLGGRVLRCPKGANLWSFRRQFRKILREGHYDVVHSHVHLFSGAVLRWAEAEGVPVRIAHSHTSRDDKPSTPARRYYRRVMQSWIKRHATNGLAASRLAAAGLFGTKWETERRFGVLYYGIDLRAFQEPVARDQVRSELGIPLDAPVVGHVGRFVPPKNHEFLLEVVHEILKRRRDIHFLLVGDGPLRPEVESRVRRMGVGEHVHFSGTRTDVPRLMRGAMDLFLFPSSQEGFGLSVVEAQAAGLDCVVSRAVPEEVAFRHHAVEFLPLDAGKDCWAERVINKLDARGGESAPGLEQAVKGRFAIQQSIRALQDAYSFVPNVVLRDQVMQTQGAIE